VSSSYELQPNRAFQPTPQRGAARLNSNVSPATESQTPRYHPVGEGDDPHG